MDSQSTPHAMRCTVFVDCMDHFTEPAYIYSQLFMVSNKIKEILCPTWNTRGTAWITFETPEDARYATEHAIGTHWGPHNRKIVVELVSDDQVPGGSEADSMLRLTDFLKEWEEATETMTVVVSNLPEKHPVRNVNEMLDKVFFEYNPENNAEVIVLNDPGTAMLHFTSLEAADMFQDWYNGEYWKNRTIYAKYVPDEEFAKLKEEKRRRKSAGKQVQFFVPGLKPDADAEYVRGIFEPFQVENVNLPDKGNFAFAFLSQQNAASFMELHPSGVKYQGRWIKARPANKGKGKRAALIAPAVQPPSTDATGNAAMNELTAQTSSLKIGTPTTNNNLPKPAVTVHTPSLDIRVTNLAYTTTKTTLKDLCKDFKTTKFVLRAKEGLAYVGFDTNAEARRAAAVLSGKKVLGRTIQVKVATGKN